MVSCDYRLLIDLKSLQKLPRTGKRRRGVLHFFHILEADAELGGDFEVVDPESMRPYQVSIVSGLAITWWLDPAVKGIKVLDIRSVVKN